MLAVLLQVQILALLHPHEARVWADGAREPVEVRGAGSFGAHSFSVEVPGLARRAYRGRLLVRPGPAELILINEVELEDYVASVVAAELDAAPLEARAALAIAARSFALAAARDGHLCDTTHCQWYRGSLGADLEAAARTRGEVLRTPWGEVAPGFHSADCGGQTLRATDVWPSAGPAAVQATARVPDDHAGPPRGHRLGLCQRGAALLATKGLRAHQILLRYFPGLRIAR